MGLKFDLELPRRDFLLKLEGGFEKKTVGIFGPSGAGKTSFFQALCGLEKPAMAKIELNGRALNDTENRIFEAPQKRGIGVVFQEKLLFPHLNVKKNLLFGVRYNNRDSLPFNDIVDLLELEKLLDSMPSEISGGEQQRAAIGRALLSGPELLLLDEPFNAVDEALRRNILPYLRRVRDELNIPMLVISHDLPDIQALTNDIYLIENGRCAGYGSVYDLLESNKDFAKTSRLTNNLELTSPQERDDGLFLCKLKNAPNCHIKVPKIPADSPFFLTLHPDEIALSLTRISGISIQNQIPGKIKKITRTNGSVYCLVDVGLPLIAKVTTYAINNMKLEEGLPVFCMFKAHALHY